MSNTPNNPNDPKPSSSGKFLDQDTWDALKASGFSEQELHKDQPLGPIFFAYSRKQAIEDGTLVDLTTPGFREVLFWNGIKVHAVMTATCFSEVIARDVSQQSAKETLSRTSYVLMRFRQAAAKNADVERVDFEVEGVDGEDVAMYAHIGPGDEGEPVLTFMLFGED